MFRNIHSSTGILVGLIFFVVIVASSLSILKLGIKPF